MHTTEKKPLLYMKLENFGSEKIPHPLIQVPLCIEHFGIPLNYNSDKGLFSKTIQIKDKLAKW
jgi:hypothetical protein